MELAELQKMIVAYLKSLNIEEGNIIMVGLMCKKEEQQWEIANWIHNNWRNGITQSQLMDKALEIMQKYQ